MPSIIRISSRNVSVTCVGLRLDEFFGPEDMGGCIDAPSAFPRGGAVVQEEEWGVFDSGHCGSREFASLYLVEPVL